MTGVFAGRARNTKHHQYYQFCSFVKDIGKKNIRTTRSYEPCFKARKLFSITRNNFSAPLLIAAFLKLCFKKDFFRVTVDQGQQRVYMTVYLSCFLFHACTQRVWVGVNRKGDEQQREHQYSVWQSRLFPSVWHTLIDSQTCTHTHVKGAGTTEKGHLLHDPKWFKQC